MFDFFAEADEQGVQSEDALGDFDFFYESIF